jgi:predicted metalloendopeptidase
VKRRIWLGAALAYVCFLGYVGKKTCSGDPDTIGDRPLVVHPWAAGPALLTPVDDGYEPCEDFANYACGSGYPLGRLQQQTAKVRSCRPVALRAFFDQLVAGTYQDGNQTTALLRDLYLRCTDEKARNAGLRAVSEQVDAIARIQTLPELAHALGVLRKGETLTALIKVSPSWESIETNEPYVARVDLALSGLSRDPANERLRAELGRHWRVLSASVGGIAPSDIEAALRIDRWLGSAHDRDPSDKPGDRPPLAAPSRLAHARFPWRAYLDGAGLPFTTPILPRSADTLGRIDALMRFPLADLKGYLKMIVVERSAEYVRLPNLEEELRFHDEIVKGGEHRPFDLSNACVDLIARDYDPWVAEAYRASLPIVDEGPARDLFRLLRDRFARNVAGATWLDAPTRQTAASKVNHIGLRFASDLDTELDGIVLPPGSYWDAVLRVGARMGQWDLAQIGTKGGRQLQATLYADGFYSPFVNSVFVHKEFAGDPWIQPRPFTAITFGSLGTIMSHEIAHALGIRGRPFNDTGVRQETWSKEAIAAFEARSACLEQELASLDRGARWHVDAHKTLNEDMAEWMGVRLALAAMDADARPTDKTARDDRHRQFFLAYSQQMCSATSSRAKYDNGDDVHPPIARILNSTLAYVPEFAEAFHCGANTRMAARDTCAIW